MPQTSKLTTKLQTTVPTSVRKLLQLKAGDMLGFEIRDGEVKLRLATPPSLGAQQQRLQSKGKAQRDGHDHQCWAFRLAR